MATMGMIKLSCKHQMIGSHQFLYLSKWVIFVSSIFYDETSNPNDRNDEITKGAEIEYDRQLSSRSSLYLSALIQETEFDEKGTLDEFTVSYQKSTSEKAEFEVFASYERFDSTDNTDEYHQTSVGAVY
jgi:hypothetical protein